MKFSRRRMLQAIAASPLAAVPLAARAQAFPSRPVTIVVPYPPGASTDQIARLVQPKLEAALGQPVVVDNRGGAGGTIGAAHVAHSPADGYRILLATQPIVTINPHLQKNFPFDPFKDLTPLTNAVNGVVSIAVSSSLPVKTLPELIEYAKKNPGKLTFGTAGTGSPQHVGGVLLGQRAQIDWVHVPYKGGGPMLTDLLGGHVNAGIATLAVFRPLLSDPRIRVIAIGDKTRFPGTPDIPAIAETLPGFTLTTWIGFYGPGSLPPEIARRLATELANALRAPDVESRLRDSALIVDAQGPEALAALQRADYDVYGKIIREHHITAQ